MKWVGRTIIILLAAMIVVAAAFAFSRSDLAAQLLPGGSGRGEFARGEFPEGVRPELPDEGGFPDRHEGEFRPDGREGGSFRWFSTLKNLGIIGVIVLIVVVLQWTWGYLRRKIRFGQARQSSQA
ncbi:MAG: hypothetical protein H6662_07970 [Ardenticatenaceae bacterium]|nr:hypothetical protein [Anaerolineales bacterium]MCB8921501.1 hypothetical protein [Ardenticatenaceae bacterium]MCB8990908.1 hypothetical protein [Ardenticatenaceae bacterium]MCB9004975.1 hypothetical protein [Ardenticatenaceae bacterium]